MGILSKILTALRGGATEVGESIVDANSIRIFEQEIRDAKTNIHKAKIDLTKVMAEQVGAKRKENELKANLEKHEDYAMEAMNKGNETLALEIAEKISELESELIDATEVVNAHSGAVERLKDLLKKSEKIIKDNERQLSMVKTTESVQKATAAVSSSLMSGTGGLSNAKESLNRIKERQQKEADRMNAAETLENGEQNLEQKLKEAGIGGQTASANDVLARLKARKDAK